MKAASKEVAFSWGLGDRRVLSEASASDLMAIAQSAYGESIPNFVKFLNDLFAQYPRGQSEVRVKTDSKYSFRGGFISDFVTEPPWAWDRYLDGETGERYVRATVRLGDTLVRIEHLAWDHFILATQSEPPDLAAWFDKWFQRPRPLEVNGLRLSGCIHSVSTPSTHRDHYVTRIDLGTAKPQAFVDLIETCQRARLSKLVISSNGRADWDSF